MRQVVVGMALAFGLLAPDWAPAEAWAATPTAGAPAGAAASLPDAPVPRDADLADAADEEAVLGGVPTGLPAPPQSIDVAAAPPTGLAHNVDRWGHSRGQGRLAFDYDALPGRLSDAALRPLWEAGLEYERAERLAESTPYYELIVAEVPEESYTYWKIARNYWRIGESLPVEAKDERIGYFELAETWAGRGIAVDPECAPCMLWKFVAMGRQATTRGLMSAVRDVNEMDALLTRGIELRPDHRDDEGNATLGNLYYAGAVFYRVVPDWWWLRLFVGVHGDKDRALEYASRAVEISSARVDYRVELGAVLLCLGEDREEPARTREGMAVLRGARTLDDYLSTDRLDKEHAAILMGAPEKACGYSRDGFIDMDALEDDARAAR